MSISGWHMHYSLYKERDMEITSDATMIRIDAFQLEDESQV